jgi:hypothetical protein
MRFNEFLSNFGLNVHSLSSFSIFLLAFITLSLYLAVNLSKIFLSSDFTIFLFPEFAFSYLSFLKVFDLIL